jgi:hypothetical protein
MSGMDLQGHVHKLWDSAISTRTANTYQTAINHFLTFVTMCGVFTPVGQLPLVSEDLIIKFIAYCHKSLCVGYSTIKLYMSGIRYHYLKAGLAKPFKNMDRIDYVLRGVRRTQVNQNTRRRFPITSTVLRDMCTRLLLGVFSPYTDIMMSAVCKMFFF